MKEHRLSVLVENRSGVLSQVTRLFSRRGYNIKSLAVGETLDENLSRISIIVTCDDDTAAQIVSQLEKTDCAVKVEVLNARESVARELLMIKVKASDRAERSEIIQLTEIFRAKIADVTANSMTIIMTGQGEKNDSFLDLLKNHEIIEFARTGTVFMHRGDRTITCAE